MQSTAPMSVQVFQKVSPYILDTHTKQKGITNLSMHSSYLHRVEIIWIWNGDPSSFIAIRHSCLSLGFSSWILLHDYLPVSSQVYTHIRTVHATSVLVKGGRIKLGELEGVRFLHSMLRNGVPVIA